MATMAQSGAARLLQRPADLRRYSALPLYLAFGGLAALVNLLTGWLLYGTGIAPWLPYWCATGIAATVGIAANFSLNYTLNFTFRDRSAFQQFGSFFMISAIGVMLTSALSAAIRAVLLHGFGLELEIAGRQLNTDFAAHVTAVGLVAVYSYPAHLFISFNVGIRARLRQLKTVVAG